MLFLIISLKGPSSSQLLSKKNAFPTSGVKKENAAGYACKGDLNHSYRWLLGEKISWLCKAKSIVHRGDGDHGKGFKTNVYDGIENEPCCELPKKDLDEVFERLVRVQQGDQYFTCLLLALTLPPAILNIFHLSTIVSIFHLPARCSSQWRLAANAGGDITNPRVHVQLFIQVLRIQKSYVLYILYVFMLIWRAVAQALLEGFAWGSQNATSEAQSGGEGIECFQEAKGGPIPWWWHWLSYGLIKKSQWKPSKKWVYNMLCA